LHIILVAVVVIVSVVNLLYWLSKKKTRRLATPTRTFGPPYEAEVSGKDFNDMVIQTSSQVPVLVDFYAEWCGACHQLAPALSKIAKAYRGVFLLAKINVDLNADLSSRYSIRAMPTVLLFRKGKCIGKFMGMQSEQSIRQFLAHHDVVPPQVILKAVK
jgi:putative thioredoxin